MRIFLKQVTFNFTVLICSLLFMQLLHTASVSALSSGSLVALTNAERSSAGLASLTKNSLLGSAATAKAQHMCTNNYWAHTAPDGTTGWYFLRQSGYDYRTAGENLARGFVDDSSVVSAWMQSAGHRANILNATFQDIGIGMYACEGDTIIVAFYAVAQVPEPVVVPPPAPAPAPVQKTPAPAQKASTPTPATKPVVSKAPEVDVQKEVELTPTPAREPEAVQMKMTQVIQSPVAPRTQQVVEKTTLRNRTVIETKDSSVVALLADMREIAETDYIFKRLLDELMATNVNKSQRAVFSALTSGIHMVWWG